MSVLGLRVPTALAAVTVIVAACGQSAATSTGPELHATSSPTVGPTAIAGLSEKPASTAIPVTFDEDVKVAADGRSVRVRCWGAGEPTILLEAGYPSAGLQQFGGATAMLAQLAVERRVCAYDRAGNGQSDPAPNEPRDLDDVTDDLHAVLDGAKIDTPVVLVGSSGGGNIVVHYAYRFPDQTLGVVMLDVPAPQANLTLEEAPELAWDSPQNPEHVEVVAKVENMQAKQRLAFAAPLLVVTATDGQSNVADQSFWLTWSTSTSRQIELSGPHEVYLGSPDEIAAAILAMPDLGS